MKYLIVMFFCLSGFMLSAQNNNDRLNAEIERTILKYQLDESQAAQARTIMQNRYNDLLTMQQQRSNDPDLKENMKALSLKYDEAFVAILNDEQKKLHNSYKEMTQPQRKKLDSPVASPGNIKGGESKIKSKTKTSNQ